MNTLYAPERPAPLWARLLGKRHRDTSYRFDWGELDHKFVGFAIEFYCYEEPGLMLAIGWPRLFINLPDCRLTRHLFGSEMDYLGQERPKYGFSFAMRGEFRWTVFACWGRRSKFIYPPWGWNKFKRDYRREYLDSEGNWRPCLSWRERGDGAEAPRWEAKWPYHYMTSDGEAQHVTATVHRERRRDVYRVFGVPVRIRWQDSIAVGFNDEVGNQRGSWKGGCIGCGYTMKPGEHPRATLTRMQRERNFDR